MIWNPSESSPHNKEIIANLRSFISSRVRVPVQIHEDKKILRTSGKLYAGPQW